MNRSPYKWAAEVDHSGGVGGPIHHRRVRGMGVDEYRRLRRVGVDRSPYKWAVEADHSPHVFGGDHGLCVLTNRLPLAHHLRSL